MNHSHTSAEGFAYHAASPGCDDGATSVGGRPLDRVRRLIESVRSRCRTAMWRRCGAEIGHSCFLSVGVEFDLGRRYGREGEIRLDDRCRLSPGVLLHAYGGSIELGRDVFLGPYTIIYGHGGVRIGHDSLLASHCRIVSANHSVPGRDRRVRWEPDIPLPVVIGEDVWLGAGVTVLGGVTIGDGCIVGAGAVVTKDLPPYSVALGVPARVVDTRK